jgi:transcriptional regulator with XRE-family HTH domain
LTLEKAFGAVLKRVRVGQDLTQLELAEKSDFDVTYISLLERGRRQPSLKAFISIAKGLGVSPVDLLRKTMKEL